MVVSSNLCFIILLGLPATIAKSGTSFVTIDPAAIIAPSPILTPLITTEFVSVHTSLPISIEPELVTSLVVLEPSKF